MGAPAHTSVSEAAEELVAGMKSGRVRTRSGDLYKPSAIRSYEAALRDHVVPQLGSTRLGDVQRRGVQQIADELLAKGRDPSTVRNALMPLRAWGSRGRGELPCARAPVAQWIEQRFPKPRAQVRFLSGALSIMIQK